EPFFDKQTKIYHVALKRDERSPFLPDDELHAKEDTKEAKDTKEQPKEQPKEQSKEEPKEQPKEQPRGVKVDIDLDGIQARLLEVPVPAGNYSELATDGKRL